MKKKRKKKKKINKQENRSIELISNSVGKKTFYVEKFKIEKRKMKNKQKKKIHNNRNINQKKIIINSVFAVVLTRFRLFRLFC